MKKILTLCMALCLMFSVAAFAADVDITATFEQTPTTKKELTEPTRVDAPMLSELSIEETGEQCTLSFRVRHPENASDAISYYTDDKEHGVYLIAQTALVSGEWTDVAVTTKVAATEQKTAAVGGLTKDGAVRLRAAYRCMENGAIKWTTAWSNVLTQNVKAVEKASDWAKEELAVAEQYQLIPDCLKGEDLQKPITRLEFAAVSVKAYEALKGKSATFSGKNPFEDCSDYEVLKALELGITTGTSETAFSPDLMLTREQACTMLARVYKKMYLPGWTLQKDANYIVDFPQPAPFKDDADISDWAKQSVYFMVAQGYVKGMGDNVFAPKNMTQAQEQSLYANATREQALLIAERMVKNIKSGSGMEVVDMPTVTTHQ